MAIPDFDAAVSMTADDIRRIASLSKLELAEDEIESYRSVLATMCGHFACLASLDLDGVEPLYHAGDEAMRLRDDELGHEHAVSADELRAMAPDSIEFNEVDADGESASRVYFRMPKTLGGGGGA